MLYINKNLREYERLQMSRNPRHAGRLLLDSSLIIQTKSKKHRIKVVDCINFKQVYFYKNERFTRVGETTQEKTKVVKFIENLKIDDTDLYKSEESRERRKESGVIEYKNILRAKMEMQRLVKANIQDFKTFITLTFDKNKNSDIDINDITSANKKFNIWKTYVKKLKNDFKYICIPEYQKRGAVHFHLLTNLDYNTSTLLLQERKIWSPKNQAWQIGKDVKGWKYGHSMAKDMKDINVVVYLSKYMTKDMDNRLFGKRKYHSSQNLLRPSETYIDFSDETEFLYYLKSLNNFEISYQSEYLDKFGNQVIFQEYKSTDLSTSES